MKILKKLTDLTQGESLKGNTKAVDYAAGLIERAISAGSVIAAGQQIASWDALDSKSRSSAAKVIEGLIDLGGAYPDSLKKVFPNGVSPERIDNAMQEGLMPNTAALQSAKDTVKQSLSELERIGVKRPDFAKLDLSAVPGVSASRENDYFSYSKKDFLSQIGIDLEGPQRKIEVSF